MPKVKTQATKAGAGRKRAAVEAFDGRESVNASSILFGLAILTALIVSAAAWMGGSLSQLERRAGHMMDSTARSLGLAVQYVSVEGVSDELAEELRFAALVEPGENMFRADPHLIRDRVEATRLVVNVQVHRFWPDHILILADAVEPVALWNDGANWAVVDGLGQTVLDTTGRNIDYNRLVRVAGVGGDVAAPGLVEALAEFPELAARVQIARRAAEERWDLYFDTGVVAHLPRDETLPSAMRRLAFMDRDSDILSRPLVSIDIRHADQVFLKPSLPETAGLSADAG
ncbi:MAG: cell division protein FtsQ/DivIB [Pseudomonadota bacterium]